MGGRGRWGARGRCRGAAGRGQAGGPVPTPFAGMRRPPALPVDAVSMATGGRAGFEPSSPGAASPAPAPSSRLDSPACGAGLAPFGVTASSSPSSRSPNHRDPRPASGSSSSRGSGGAAMAGGPGRSDGGSGGWRCGGRTGRRSPLLPAPGLGAWEAAVSAPPPPLRPSCCPPRSPLQLLLLPAPCSRPAACAPPPARAAASLLPGLRYAGGNGSLWPRLPWLTAAPGLLTAGPAHGRANLLES